MNFKIGNYFANISEHYVNQIQPLLDEIIILSTMMHSVEFFYDEHVSFLRVGYTINPNTQNSVGFVFCIMYDYNYEEKKYVNNKNIHSLTLHLPFNTVSFFQMNNKNIQRRKPREMKTSNCEAMIEMLEEVKKFILYI